MSNDRYPPRVSLAKLINFQGLRKMMESFLHLLIVIDLVFAQILLSNNLYTVSSQQNNYDVSLGYLLNKLKIEKVKLAKFIQ